MQLENLGMENTIYTQVDHPAGKARFMLQDARDIDESIPESLGIRVGSSITWRCQSEDKLWWRCLKIPDKKSCIPTW